MEFNFLAIFVASIVPIVLGFIWYNPKVFGTLWMREAELTEAKIKSGNMALIFGVSIVLSILLAFFTQVLTIHQIGAYGMVEGQVTDATYTAFMEAHGHAFRTYKHGFAHGIMAGLFFAFPVIGINALFERKSLKYIFLNSAYWVLCLGVMGAIVCGWK